MAHLISFVYSLHYCALHNLSCQSRFVGEKEGKRESKSKLESSPSLSFNCLCLCNFRKHKVKLEFWPSSPFLLYSPLRKESMSTNYHSYLIFLFNALIIGQIATPKAFCSSPGTQSRCPMAATCSGDDLCPIKNWASRNVSPSPKEGKGFTYLCLEAKPPSYSQGKIGFPYSFMFWHKFCQRECGQLMWAELKPFGNSRVANVYKFSTAARQHVHKAAADLVRVN